jgi:hypothetical protein
MPMFTLNINIDGPGLKDIAGSGQRVTLTKKPRSFVELKERGAHANQNSVIVAWQAFQPFEFNVVTWDESYSLYATTTPLDTGNIIALNAVTDAPAIPGFIYAFTGGPPNGSPGEGNTFNLSNQMSSGSFSFGLAQIATVNDSPSEWVPLNASPMLFNETAEFTPTDTVYIFLSSCGSNGTVIPEVPEKALAITLSSANPTATVTFDDANNAFFLLSQP